jgi:hypothetical protein
MLRLSLLMESNRKPGEDRKEEKLPDPDENSDIFSLNEANTRRTSSSGSLPGERERSSSGETFTDMSLYLFSVSSTK